MSGSAKTIGSEYAREKAESNGWVIREPAPDELFVDIDSEEDFAVFEKNVDLFDEHIIGVEGWQTTRSKSGKPHKRHVIVRLERDVTPFERLFYQALLGSDRKRELLGLVRVNANDPTPTLFFEKGEAP